MPDDTQDKKNKVSKTINYYRVNFHEPSPYPLEHYLRQAHESLSLVKERTFKLGTQEIKGCHVEQSPTRGCFAHVSLTTPGEPATTVPDEQDAEHVDLEQTPPPPKSSFMDGDMNFFLKDNHLLFCATNLTVGRVRDYIREVLERSGQPEDASAFTFTQIADVDKLQMLQAGVSSVSLGAGLYSATVQHHERQTVRRQLMGGLMHDLFALFQQDPNLKDYTEPENITAELVIKFNRALKGGTKGQLRMQKFSEMVLNDEEKEGFTIRTYNNETVTAEDVVLRKTIKVEKSGKTVHYRAVWDSMWQYFEELRTKGLLEQ